MKINSLRRLISNLQQAAVTLYPKKVLEKQWVYSCKDFIEVKRYVFKNQKLFCIS